jgi:predicted thioredoxin/glutaredoxin
VSAVVDSYAARAAAHAEAMAKVMRSQAATHRLMVTACELDPLLPNSRARAITYAELAADTDRIAAEWERQAQS